MFLSNQLLKVMKFKLFTLLFLLNAFISKAQVIFDPATYPQDSLPAGMTIDTIDGKPYVRVILDGWNSFIKINPGVILDDGVTHFRAVAKLGAGVSGFELSKINTFLKLAAPDWTELAVAGNASSESFAKYQVAIASTGTVGYLQVAGQETTGWSAVVGDTLWLGKVTAVKVDPQAIFDPNNYDPELLPAGMSIVEINGEKYCQIILNGWNSVISTFPFNLTSGYTHFRAKVKYGAGVSGYELSKINTFLKLAAPDWTELAVAGSASSPDFSVYKVSVAKTGTVGFLQVAGQETTNWNAVTGDTLWIGKVRAVKVEPWVVFDPAQYDPDELPDNMEIVKIGNTKYLQVILNGWNSFIHVDPINATAAHTHFSADAKFAIGATDTLSLSQINTFLKLASADFATEIGAAGSASNAEFKKYKVNIATTGTVGAFQMAGQETIKWGAVVGDTLWIGKLVFEDNAAPTAPTNLTATVNNSTVTLTWTASTDNNKVAGYIVYQGDVKLDSITATTYDVTGLAEGNYTFSVVAADPSGNRSSAVTVDATVGGVGINSLTGEKLNIYPNPAISTVYIKGLRNIVEVNVINITGTVVLKVYNSDAIGVTDLKEGLYLMKVKTTSDVFTTTFIKK